MSGHGTSIFITSSLFFKLVKHILGFQHEYGMMDENLETLKIMPIGKLIGLSEQCYVINTIDNNFRIIKIHFLADSRPTSQEIRRFITVLTTASHQSVS
jgi:hypothetical protein